MNNRITRVFDEITPLSSDIELYVSTLEKASRKAENMEKGTKKHRVGRPLTVLCSIIAAAALGTISVGAYYNWDFGSFLKTWGGEENADTLDMLASEVVVTNMRNTFENLDITVSGALKDGDINVVFVNLERTDGKNFKHIERTSVPAYNENGELELWEYSYSIDPLFGKVAAWYAKEYDAQKKIYTNYDVWVQHFPVKDDDPYDNKMTYVFAWTDNEKAHGNTLELVIKDGLYTDDYEYVYNSRAGGYDRRANIIDFMDGSYYAKLTIAKNESAKRQTECNVPITLKSYGYKFYDVDNMEGGYQVNENKDYVVTSLTVSAMSVSYEISAVDTDYIYDPMIFDDANSVYLNMKDGSRIKAAERYDDETFWTDRAGADPGGVISSVTPLRKRQLIVGDTYLYDNHLDYRVRFMLTELIDVNEVESVTIGSATIPLG